jgi:hypothetical protein
VHCWSWLRNRGGGIGHTCCSVSNCIWQRWLVCMVPRQSSHQPCEPLWIRAATPLFQVLPLYSFQIWRYPLATCLSSHSCPPSSGASLRALANNPPSHPFTPPVSWTLFALAPTLAAPYLLMPCSLPVAFHNPAIPAHTALMVPPPPRTPHA